MLGVLETLALIGHGIVLQFVHLVGAVVAIACLVFGYFRAPWPPMPLLALVLGFNVGWLPPENVEFLDQVSQFGERGVFLVVVYCVIVGASYAMGRLARNLRDKTRQAPRRAP